VTLPNKNIDCSIRGHPAQGGTPDWLTSLAMESTAREKYFTTSKKEKIISPDASQRKKL
jgi:hypothetical protein